MTQVEAFNTTTVSRFTISKKCLLSPVDETGRIQNHLHPRKIFLYASFLTLSLQFKPHVTQEASSTREAPSVGSN